MPLMGGERVVGVFGLLTGPLDEEASTPPAHLTPRQAEVLRLLEQGRSTKQIAQELHLSTETVRNHVRHLLRALGVTSRLEAVAAARRCRASEVAPAASFSRQPGCRFERLRSHPQNLIRVMPAKGVRMARKTHELGHRAGAGAPACSDALDTILSGRTWASRCSCSSAARTSALSLRDALIATLVGGLIGNLMLGVAAMIGADARVPSMVLQRSPLGHRGSYLATVLNVGQCLGWAIFELIIIAVRGRRALGRLFGFQATGSGRSSSAARPGACAPGPDRLRPALRAASSRSGRSRASIVYLTVWILGTPTSERSGRRRAKAARSGSASTS